MKKIFFLLSCLTLFNLSAEELWATSGTMLQAGKNKTSQTLRFYKRENSVIKITSEVKGLGESYISYRPRQKTFVYAMVIIDKDKLSSEVREVNPKNGKIITSYQPSRRIPTIYETVTTTNGRIMTRLIGNTLWLQTYEIHGKGRDSRAVYYVEAVDWKSKKMMFSQKLKYDKFPPSIFPINEKNCLIFETEMKGGKQFSNISKINRTRKDLGQLTVLGVLETIHSFKERFAMCFRTTSKQNAYILNTAKMKIKPIIFKKTRNTSGFKDVILHKNAKESLYISGYLRNNNRIYVLNVATGEELVITPKEKVLKFSSSGKGEAFYITSKALIFLDKDKGREEVEFDKNATITEFIIP